MATNLRNLVLNLTDPLTILIWILFDHHCSDQNRLQLWLYYFYGFTTEIIMKVQHSVAYLTRNLMRNRAVSIKRSIPHCHFIPFPWIFYFSCTIKWFQKFSIALWTTKSSNTVYIWRFNSVHTENMKLVISTSFSRSHKFIADDSSEIRTSQWSLHWEKNETRSCYGTQYQIHNLDQTLE